MLQQPALNTGWLTQETLVSSDYRALLELRHQTPWGEDWGGEQAYSRTPGLSLAELDQAWMIERWRFASQNSHGSWSFPQPQQPKITALGVQLIGLIGAVVVLDGQSVWQLLVLSVGMGSFAYALRKYLRPYLPYWRARRAYQTRRKALVERSGRA